MVKVINYDFDRRKQTFDLDDGENSPLTSSSHPLLSMRNVGILNDLTNVEYKERRVDPPPGRIEELKRRVELKLPLFPEGESNGQNV